MYKLNKKHILKEILYVIVSDCYFIVLNLKIYS